MKSLAKRGYYKISELRKFHKDDLMDIILENQYENRLQSLTMKELELELKYLKKTQESL